MQNRLARIFRPETGRTTMLAIDHGYFQGPTTGLERVDLSIVPLAAVRRRAHGHAGRPALGHPLLLEGGMVLRASGGPSILKELSDEEIAVDIEDAVALERRGSGRAGIRRRRPRNAIRA